MFLLIDENHGYANIIGNPVAPELNALASDYGVATRYNSTSDPSEPNYVAMLGGSAFGINSDDPYWFPGHTVHADNLMSQLQAAGLTWKGYFQGMPYDGFRGYCFPAKCNGIPDADTQYVAKHNGIVNFANMQTPAELAHMTPYQQLSTDLATGKVPNFSYIVPDECDDMHGAPPWCVDSSFFGDVDDNWLVSRGDAFAGQTVKQITSSPIWRTGNNAIVLTFDEGNGGPPGTGRVSTIVVTNHGPRGLKDNTAYNHYSLLASLQHAFGLGCLLNSCTASAMTPLFQEDGLPSVPVLPPAYVPPPNGTNAVSQMQSGVPGAKVSLTCSSGWTVVKDPSFGSFDNNLAAVSAASSTDAWAVGAYYPASTPNVLVNQAQHFDGTRWTAYALPNVGLNENTLLGVSDPSPGDAWAVGYYVDANYRQRVLVEHWDGVRWSVVPAPSPGVSQNILYGVTALSDDDVWAVGGQEDAFSRWHTLIEHWDGTRWSVVQAPDPGNGGNLLYGVSSTPSGGVYAVGQQAGNSFPSHVLLEQLSGNQWLELPSPTDASATLTPLGIGAARSGLLTVVGQRETNASPNTTLAAVGARFTLNVAPTPNRGTGENDLFGVATDAEGTTWAGGWYLDPASGNDKTLMLKSVGGHWALVASPNPSNAGSNGFAGLAAVPGGGVWAVGVSSDLAGNAQNLIAYHC